MQVLKRGSARAAGLALLCLFAVIVPLLAGPGPVLTRGGGDSPFLLVRLEQLVAGLRSGAFPVRWMPDAAYGLGYPFFNFYAALPYYLAAGLRLLGWGPIRALQATHVLGFVLALAAMALLARRLFRHPAAVALAVAAYTCAPFHLANVYVRGDSLSEFYAFCFYPLIFWALLGLRDRPSPAGAGWLALSYGGLILTHNLSAIMFTPFIAAFALWLVVPPIFQRGTESRRAGWRAAGWMVCGGVLGLALSATLWLAAAGELDEVWMGVKDIQTSGYFNYAGHFRQLLGPGQVPALIQPSVLFDYEPSPGRTPFAMGAVQAVMILLATIAWCVGRLRRGGDDARFGARTGDRSPDMTLFWLLGLASSTLLMTPAWRFLWDHLPILPIVQFPWRFLSVQAFFGALIAAGLALWLPRPWLVALGGTVLLTLAAVGGLRPEYLPIHENDVTEERLALFELFTTNVGTTIRSEYLPADVEPGLLASAVTHTRGQRPAPMLLSGEVTAAELVQRDARTERWRVMVASEDARLAFYTLHYPGWQAQVDGVPAQISPLPSSGLISIPVPQGEHTVRLQFRRTAVRWIADLLSLAAALGIAVLFWLSARAMPGLSWRPLLFTAAIAVLSIGALAFVGRALLPRGGPPAQDDLSMDFDRMPFLHHNPGGIDFGAARLVSYDYTNLVRGGQEWTATLHWTQGADLVAELQLVSPADPLDLAPLPLPLAHGRAGIRGETTVHVLSVPEDVAPGPYYVAVRVFDSSDEPNEIRAVNARGDMLGTTYLRPVWVDNARPVRGSEPLLARFGERILLQDNVRVEQDGANWDVRLTWQAMTPVAINYTCSLRMLAADGTPLAQRDWAEGPGYGFWPTSAWPVGEWLTDRLRLAIPPGVEAGQAVAMSIVLYDRSQPGYPALGTTVVPLIERDRRFEAPPMRHPVGATFGGQVALLGYDLDQTPTSLDLTLHWQALPQQAAEGRLASDYIVFVHLYDPESETIVAQSDARPLQGTYPTHAWHADEVVSDEIVLPLTDVPSGTYRLAVGMVEANSRDRAPIVNALGEGLPGGRLILAHEIALPAQ